MFGAAQAAIHQAVQPPPAVGQGQAPQLEEHE